MRKCNDDKIISEMDGNGDNALVMEISEERIDESEKQVDEDDEVFQTAMPVQNANEMSLEVKAERTSDSSSSAGHQIAEDDFPPVEDDEEGDNEHEEDGGEPGKFFFRLLPTHCARGKGGRKVYKCDVCGGVYRHAFSLKRHYLRTHINYEYLSDADISNCNISTSQTMAKKADDAAAIDADDESGLLRGLYRCHMCGQLFDGIHQLKHHIVNHPTQANEKRFPCTQCDMTFSHRQNLVRHLSVHSGEKPYPCRYCGKCFPTATNQKRHERIHEGVKPYVCNHCTSLFTQSGDLKKHIRKQHAHFFHPCAFCVKYFIDENQLAKHLTTHGEALETNRKEWAKRNATASTVKNRRNVATSKNNKNYNGEGTTSHRNTLHHNKFNCSTCSKKFGSYLNLRRHQQSVHAKSGGRNSRLTSSIIKPIARATSRDRVLLRELPMTEADFYADIAYNISDNLLNHLDGKIGEINQTASSDEGQNRCSTDIPIERVDNHDWTSYNFPSWFAPQSTAEDDKTAECSQNAPNQAFDFSTPKTVQADPTMHVESVTLSHSDMLYSLALSPVENDGNSAEFQCVDGVLDLSAPGKGRRNSHCSAEHSHAWQIPRTFVCFACGEKETSCEDMENHKINNHPNVYCTHIEIEGIKDMPLQLFKQNCSPNGILHNCTVAPLISSIDSLVCTKCGSSFSTVPDLHCHMLECGGHKESARNSSRQRRSRSLRRKKLVKRGMKRKLEDTPLKKNQPLKKIKKESSERLVPAFTRSSITTKPCLSMPYSCSGCNKKFNQQSGLDRHVKNCPQSTAIASKKLDRAKEASKQQHSCPYCVRSFTYLASLKKHVSDCVLRKQKRRIEEAKNDKKKKSPKSKQENSTATAVEDDSSSERDEETTSSGFSSSGKLEITTYDDSSPAAQPTPPAQLSVMQIKKETAEENGGQDADNCSRVARGSEVNSFSEDDEENCVTEIKMDDEKREVESGHCHSCPHCRRTYTYLANFKKHVTEACPLRKDPPKGTQRNVKDTKLLVEINKKGKDAGVVKAEVTNEDEDDEEMEVAEEEEIVDEEASRGSLESSAGEDSKLKAKNESRVKRKTKTNEHLSCPICHRSFVSYVKLLQHQLSHKLKQDEKTDQNESKTKLLPHGCDRDSEATPKINQSVGPRTKTSGRRKTPIMSKTCAPKHKGGWPKGKSRKGYIPKHKRGVLNSATPIITTAPIATSTPNTDASTKSVKMEKTNTNNNNSNNDDNASGATSPKTDRGKESDGSISAKEEEEDDDAARGVQNVSTSQPTTNVALTTNKVPVEEQPSNKNVTGVNHAESFRATGVLHRVKARSTKNSLISSKPESAPPAVVAS